MSALVQKRTSQHASEQSPGFLAIPSHTMAIGLGAAGGGKHNQPLSRILSDVRFGSKADIRACSGDVHFTPNSELGTQLRKCPLCAKSKHSSLLQGKPCPECDQNCPCGPLNSAFDASSIEPRAKAIEKQGHDRQPQKAFQPMYRSQ